MITGIDFVSLYVADLGRAIAHYRDTLGLAPGDLSNDEFFELDLGPGPALALDAYPFVQPNGPDRPGHVAIPAATPGTSTDPDGNRVTLHAGPLTVTLPVAQMPRARAFYEGELGLQPAPGATETRVEYRFPDAVLVLEAGAAPAQHLVVGLRTPDIEAAYARLKPYAVLEAPMETPVCHVGFLKDPEGNPLTLHRVK